MPSKLIGALQLAIYSAVRYCPYSQFNLHIRAWDTAAKQRSLIMSQ